MAVTLTFPASSGDTLWQPIKIGGGGWNTGMDFSSDGLTRMVRTDTFGSYVWDQAGGTWRQTITHAGLPAEINDSEFHDGIYDIAVAPSNSAIIYQVYMGYVIKSVDRGLTWTVTGFARQQVDLFPNVGGVRVVNKKLAVDPANANVVYLGTKALGVFKTEDGGTSWSVIPTGTIPFATDNHAHTITFDPSSGTTGGKTNRIIISSGHASTGGGIYQTTNAGSSWTNIAAASGPTHGRLCNAKMSSTGVFFCVENFYYEYATNKVWRYASGAWTNISPMPGGTVVLAINPNNLNQVVVTRNGGYLNVTNNALAATPTWSVTDLTHDRSGSDAPWLDWTEEEFMSEGDIQFDPVVAGRLWLAMGIGPCYTDTVTHTGTVWTFVANGIEQLVSDQILAPPGVGAKPFLAVQDRGVFRIANPDAFPATHGPNADNPISHGWGIDHASSDPTFLALSDSWANGTAKDSYSTDGGLTWTYFAAQTPNYFFPGGPQIGGYGGSIAASTPSNIIRALQWEGDLYYTTNGGAAWTRCVVGTIPASTAGGETTGWGASQFAKRKAVAADRVTANKFYAYNYGHSLVANTAGVYVTTNGGASWTKVRSGTFGPYDQHNAWLDAFPGNAGHLLFTAGHVGGIGAAGSYLWYCRDAGVTWTQLSGPMEIHCFGFGKAAPTSDYPTVFIRGWVDDVFGIWRTTSNSAAWNANAVAWTKIGDFPHGWQDFICTMDGDKNTFGTVYVGYIGSGASYGRLV